MSQQRGRDARMRILTLLREREGYSYRNRERPPTVREVAAAVGLSVAATHRHIEILTERGMLAPRPARKARTIRLSED